VVSDIPISHPSASKQHAVIQFRQTTERNEFGDTKTAIKPFVIDLDSTNGTFVNDQEIPTSRFYELRQSDVLKFAQSTREYVLLHEESA
jgi:smad nuclear-interacting protein 1